VAIEIEVWSFLCYMLRLCLLSFLSWWIWCCYLYFTDSTYLGSWIKFSGWSFCTSLNFNMSAFLFLNLVFYLTRTCSKKSWGISKYFFCNLADGADKHMPLLFKLTRQVIYWWKDTICYSRLSYLPKRSKLFFHEVQVVLIMFFTVCSSVMYSEISVFIKHATFAGCKVIYVLIRCLSLNIDNIVSC
jgi:hypothetical protein